MADYYCTVTMETAIKCPKAAFAALEEAWNESFDGRPDAAEHGLTLDYEETSEELYIYSDGCDYGQVSEISPKALLILGTIIASNDLPYIELGWASYCSKPRPGSSSGGDYRIYRDGTLRWPKLVWEET